MADRARLGRVRRRGPGRPGPVGRAWRLGRWFLPIPVVVVAVVALYPRWVVAAVEVDGLNPALASQVRSALSLEGRPMLDFDRPYLETALLARFPDIKSVRITRVLPNRVRVEAEERKPVLVWQRGTQSFLVDEDGFIYRPAPASSTLPRLVDAGGGDPAAARLDPAAVRTAVWLWQVLPAEFGVTPARVEYSAVTGFVVTTPAGQVWRLGQGEGLEERVAVLREVLAREPGARVVDLRGGRFGILGR